MAFVRGERVHFDFESGQAESASEEQQGATAPVGPTFVADILERQPPSTRFPPSAPKPKPNAGGFPVHKKRSGRVSAFKQQRHARDEVSFISEQHGAPTSKPPDKGNEQDEQQSIDQENKQRMADMSSEEIEREREELLSALSPSLIQRLLARSNIDEGSNEQVLMPEAKEDVYAASGEHLQPRSEGRAPSANLKKVSFAEPESPASKSSPQLDIATNEASSPPKEQGEAKLPQSEGSIHFPRPRQPPDLDPNSTTFLSDLHDKYFPDLPYDPASLSWMTPIDPNDTKSPYHPSQIALDASELRFDFKGALIAPSKAREIPVTEGLHHHSEAPEAAGYTIPELSILARSAVPTQRCIAFQILGRVLYRLGRGEYGTEKERKAEHGPVKVAINPDEEEEKEVADDEEAGSAMATGLWNCIEEGKVIETLTQEAAKEKGHLTAISYAQEALWNWRRGGGRKRQAV